MADDLQLDYASPGRQRQGWITKTAKIFGVCIGIVAAMPGGFWLVVWMIFHQMDRVTLTVDNQTGSTLDSAQITDGNGVPILTIGPIAPGKQSSASTHFGNDEGGESYLIISCGTKKTKQAVWMLINTHGPYEYTAVVRGDGVHMDYDIASKGSGAYDFRSPTTMP